MRRHRHRVARWTLASCLVFSAPVRAQTDASAAPSSGSLAPAPAAQKAAPESAASATPSESAPPVASAAPVAPTPPAAAPASASVASAPAPVTAPAPVPAPAAASTAAPVEPRIPTPATPPAGSALVHLYADYANATLELRNAVDPEGFKPACAAPCDQVLAVDGKEARVTAPGMTPSNVFLIQGGVGTAQFRVSGGSARARTFGLIGLGSGIPVALGGGALYGWGHQKDSSGLKTAGVALLIAGALEIAVGLPLLVAGSTSVRDSKGSKIARVLARGAEF